MSSKNTYKPSNQKVSTSDPHLAIDSYSSEGRYVSENTDITASSRTEHIYEPSSSRIHVSTVSSRARDRVTEVNNRLKSIAR